MIKNFVIKDLIDSEDFPFCIQIARLTSDFDVHTHDFSELVVILDGAANHIIDGEKYRIEAGDVFVLNGNVTHGFVDVDGLKLCNIMFIPQRLLVHGNDLKKLPGFQALFVLEPFYRKEHQFKSKLRLNAVSMQIVEEMLQNIMAEYKSKKDGYETMIWAYFMQLVVFLSREYTDNRKPLQNKVLKFAQAVTYMEKNYLEPISLATLSSIACLSARHFSRVFKQNYHVAPIEYIITLRLEHARRLLLNSDMPITQIADESGFSDSNYFARQFKKAYGLSPSQYRMNYHR